MHEILSDEETEKKMEDYAKIKINEIIQQNPTNLNQTTILLFDESYFHKNYINLFNQEIIKCVENGANNLDLFLEISVYNENTELIKFFMEKGAKITDKMIKEICKSCYLDLIVYLVNEGVKLDIPPNLDRIDVLDILIEKEMFDGKKALVKACQEQDNEIIEYFMYQGWNLYDTIMEEESKKTFFIH